MRVDVDKLEALEKAQEFRGEWEGDEYGLHGPAQSFNCDCGMGEKAACALAAAINALPSLVREVRELRGIAEAALGQAKMYFEREWYAAGGLQLACEELQGQGYGGDVDDIRSDMMRALAPPLLEGTRLAKLKAEFDALARYDAGGVIP